MKLTADLISRSGQFINALRERELDLRGNKIAMIENLGAAKDQFDTIDLSDNEIRKLDNFPRVERLRTLFVSNNRINRIGQGLEKSLLNLTTLILANNHFTELAEITPLASVKTLRSLSLMENQIVRGTHYRLFIIHTLPQLKLLDYRKITKKEREDAKKLFSGKKGKDLETSLSKLSKTIEEDEEAQAKPVPNSQTSEDVHRIKEAIKNAKTLEEMTYLENILKSGGKLPPLGGKSRGIEEVEEDE